MAELSHLRRQVSLAMLKAPPKLSQQDTSPGLLLGGGDTLAEQTTLETLYSLAPISQTSSASRTSDGGILSGVLQARTWAVGWDELGERLLDSWI